MCKVKRVGIIEQIRAGELGEEDLLEYITDNDVNVAIAVAESEMATDSILDIAAHDRDRSVRLAAVNNPNIAEITLRFLLNDLDEEIVEKAFYYLERYYCERK